VALWKFFLLSCAWLAVVLGLALRALHQSNQFQAVVISRPPVNNAPRVALIVPARDEEQVPFWYGFLFPVGYTAGALMSVDSVRRRWSGRVSWKGRTYPTSSSQGLF
jgi:hypothetical protein